MRTKTLLHSLFYGLLIGVLIAAGAAAIGFVQYQNINRQTATQTLDASQSVMQYVHERQVQRLQEVSNTIATNPSFVSYISQAMSADLPAGQLRDVASIRDLLDERRKDAGLNTAAILDVSGKVVASVGDNFLAERQLTTSPLVAQTRQSGNQTVGVLDDDKRLPLIVVTPLTRGSGVEALLVTAQRFDESALKSMAQIGRVDLALITLDPTGPRLVTSTLTAENSAALTSELGRLQDHFPKGASPADKSDVDLNFGGRANSARTVLLHPGNDKALLMMIVPDARRNTLCAALGYPLLIGVLCALAIALIFSFLRWRRFIHPLTAVAEMSERAARGDYALQTNVTGSPLVRRLASAVNALLSGLDRHRVAPGTPRRRATDQR
jgi:Double sensory domain of two-component sensor kinase